MARSRATIYSSIWDDPDFTSMPGDAQRLYFFLCSQPKLSMVGCIDYVPTRWARKAHGLTVEAIEAAIAELEHRRYVLVDKSESELLVRTMVKHDEARNYKTRKAMWEQWKAVASPALKRAVIDAMPDHMWTDPQAEPPATAVALRNEPPTEPTREPPTEPRNEPRNGPRTEPPTEPVRARRPSALCLPPSSSTVDRTPDPLTAPASDDEWITTEVERRMKASPPRAKPDTRQWANYRARIETDVRNNPRPAHTILGARNRTEDELARSFAAALEHAGLDAEAS